jgi:IS605 OrfB family transposase
MAALRLDSRLIRPYTVRIKLTIQLRVLPDAEQAAELLDAMTHFNAAASFAATVGLEAKVSSQPSIHKRCYAELRERFGLSAQMAVRAIGEAVEALESLKAKGETGCPEFQPHGAVTYDERILSFRGPDKVSLRTLKGRLVLPTVYGEYQGRRFDRIKGQADLVYRGGKFFLHATVEVPEEAPIEPEDWLGVDLGIVNLATDSDGEDFSGDRVEEVRRKYRGRRRGLNRKGTKSARRRLRKVRKRESNFRRDENHRISKAIVARAKATGRGIVLEDLEGITGRVSVRREQRARLKGWAFDQLRRFIEYKARLAGVPVLYVDPADTSRTCAECGHCEKANRRSRDHFECRHCGHSDRADANAARNIRAKGRSQAA